MSDFSRYSRQMRFAEFSESAQQMLSESHVLVCGCGALGSVIANTLARAGVGRIRLVDRDILEISNLQRQILFDENDVAAGLPKSVAAKNRLAQVNSDIEVEAIVADVNADNISSLGNGIDVILDGTDNFETRFLLNDYSVYSSIPWIYGGCLGADGQTMTILPGQTACLRCLMQEGPPPPGTTPTCDSAGILAPIISTIASLQSMEALKILTGNTEAVSRKLTIFELWENRIRQLDISQLRASQTCQTCHLKKFQWLEGESISQATLLCGRNSVQLNFRADTTIDLESTGKRLAADGQVTVNRFLLKFAKDEFELTLFPDGRAIVFGTEDPSVAKSIYARWIGN